MKRIFLAILSLSFMACASKKGTTAFINGKHTIESPCPEEGECKLEILKDKSLDIKVDDTGRLYYSITDAPGKVVMRYRYDYNAPEDVMDGGYTETIMFETDNEFSNLNTGNIKDTKMIFGVQCFCRDKAGFYKVTDGEIGYKDQKLTVRIPDTVIDGQLIHSIDVSLK